jgi:hypothetical protein
LCISPLTDEKAAAGGLTDSLEYFLMKGNAAMTLSPSLPVFMMKRAVLRLIRMLGME